MRINELLCEDRDSIRTYWQLRVDIDFESYYDAYVKIVNDQNKFRAKQDMIMLLSHVHDLLTNPDWQHLENDQDFESLYNELLELHDVIQTYINS